MSIDSSTRTAVPGSRPSGSTTALPGGALYGATGEHIGLSPVAKALHTPTGMNPAPPAHPVPTQQRLLALSLAAALLSFAGIVVGVRGWVGLVMDKAESWFLATIVIMGVIGVITAVSSFLTVHRRYAPWVMITLSGLVLIAGMIVTAAGLR